MGFKLPWRLLIPPGSVDTVIGTGLELARTGATVQLVREVFDVDGQRAANDTASGRSSIFVWNFGSNMFLQDANEPA